MRRIGAEMCITLASRHTTRRPSHLHAHTVAISPPAQPIDDDDDYACRGGGGDVAYCEGDQRDLLRAVGPSGQLMLEPHGLFVGVSSV